MDPVTLTSFYSEDHTRLDGLFARYQERKHLNPEDALKILQEFKSGLEQHMAWEEACLFSEYEARPGVEPENGPTEDLRFVHEQLRDELEAILRTWRDNGSCPDKDEARFAEILAAHNWAEESDFYRKLDDLLSDEDRTALFERMKRSAW
jgi:hypothetical protein